MLLHCVWLLDCAGFGWLFGEQVQLSFFVTNPNAKYESVHPVGSSLAWRIQTFLFVGELANIVHTYKP